MSRNILLATACWVALFASARVMAIDGPGVFTIPNANWGGAGDIWPHVVRVEIDLDGDGDFTDFSATPRGATFCSGTLIAPDVVATAGHCFRHLGANMAIPANQVQINFGPNAATPTILNNGGQTHLINGAANSGQPNDFALVTLASAAPVSPIPILTRIPRVGDTNFAIGFGVAGTNNGMNANRATAIGINNFPQHSNGAKNWATITVDAVTGAFDANGNVLSGNVEQDQQTPEDWTEGGDSGGPGIQRHTNFPNRAWGNTIGNLARGDFVMSAVSGGFTPSTNDSSIAANVTYTGNVGSDDFWTRLDGERNFIHTNAPFSMLPDTIQIFHNLPTTAAELAAIGPNDQIGVFVRGSWAISRALGLVNDYLLNVNIWEEDDQLGAGPYSFSGDMNLAPTNFMDDLAGFGFSAGSFAGAQTDVVSWDFRDASDILAFDEAGNPMDPDLDWIFQVNYGDLLQFTNGSAQVTATNLAGVQAAVGIGAADIMAGTAVRGGLAIVGGVPIPEPTSIAIAAIVVAIVGVTRRIG